jgi:hypothetical protein
MKNILVILVVMMPLLTQAQGTVYASNLGETPTGTFTVAGTSWVAQRFIWLGKIVNGVELVPDCMLNSVQLLLNPATGNPSGFSVSIYTAGASGPGTSLGTLTGAPNPDNAGVYTYTTSGITLSPATAYFVVVTSQTPAAQGVYNWSTATNYGKIANGNLTIDDVYSVSSDGLGWNVHLRQEIAQMAVYGTPVPEPSPGCLCVCGVGMLVYVGKRRRSCQSKGCSSFAPLRPLRP